MWAYESVFYQICPLGFCDTPRDNDGVTVNRIQKVADWIPHIKALGVDAVYLCPIFSSDRHGYDTRDFRVLDPRLGTNEDFAAVCTQLHENGIRVVLDGVFNHVGRGFWAFQDVLHNRENSPYRDWFVNLWFGGDNGYHDGLTYEGWEGHQEMVKLNLKNWDVVQHLLDCVGGWIDAFHIDGLRLDVAYSLDLDFLYRLRGFCQDKTPDFFLVGEMMHGDYKRLMNDELLHSVTNYQAYKGLWSSFNSMNLFEIHATLEQHFTQQYVGRHTLNFVDNHDVTRIASLLTNPAHLKLIYGLLFAMPGIPSLYYGSEWGATGVKIHESDDPLRPSFDAPEENELSRWIAQLSAAHRGEKALCYGSFQKILLTNKQYIFQREWEGERILVALNIESEPFSAHFNANAGCATDVITGAYHDFGGGSQLPPYSISYWKVQ